MKKLEKFYSNYKHGIPLIVFGAIYLSWFFHLEQTVTKDYRVIHMAVDDYIPFCEVFVIPYFLWFFYVAGVVMFFFFKNKEDYYKTCAFLFTGMTIFLIVSTLWPNGHHLRPLELPRDNIFTQMIARLWSTDTPTNLWPSIHVYNSLGAYFAIARSREFAGKKALRIGALALSVSIILSTVLIKQHSVFDVLTAFAMAAVMYAIVYRYDVLLSIRQYYRTKRKLTPQVE